jgi:uncharacterized membrane protein
MMIYLNIIAIIALAAIEGRPLLRDRKWAELAVFSVLLLIATAVIIMDSVSKEPFRVSMVVDLIFRPYTSMVKKLLTGS